MKDPVISIICNTYNQEKYIETALNSFLMQRIDVPIEILVHDDASTDATADIVRDYESKYPDIIKPIYQAVNQYSQNISITAVFQIPRAHGKYIAFCEGDDYWTDPKKLQIQFDFMEQHPECSACCHAYNMVYADGTLMEKRHDFVRDMVIPMKRLLGNQLEVPQFATLFARHSCLKEYSGDFLGITGDMAIRLFCATQGTLYYINRNMSCYRRFTEGSWSRRIGKNKQALAESMRNGLAFFEKFNHYTNGEYIEELDEASDSYRFKIALLEDRYKDAYQCRAFKNASIKQRMYIRIGCFVPRLIKHFRNKKSVVTD